MQGVASLDYGHSLQGIRLPLEQRVQSVRDSHVRGHEELRRATRRRIDLLVHEFNRFGLDDHHRARSLSDWQPHDWELAREEETLRTRNRGIALLNP